MLHITLSNRFDDLLDDLLNGLAAPMPSVFDTRFVIVPSVAVRRKLGLAIADKEGISAHIRFPFLAQWLWELIRAQVKLPETQPFEKETLQWRIFRQLEEGGWTAAYPRLSAWLANSDPLMRHSISKRLAALLDQYIAYRPDWLAAWSAQQGIGFPPAFAQASAFREHEAWQGELWRKLTDEIGVESEHPAEQFFALLEAQPDSVHLPERIPVFCPVAIAPQYIHILDRLAQWTDVHLYLFNPCGEYWLDIVDEKQMAYLARRGRLDYHEIGNSLLASWGKQSQSFLKMLMQETRHGYGETDRYLSPAQQAEHPRLLNRVQAAILHLEEPEAGAFADTGVDESIRIHCCHSLTREMEVLHDQLLLAFAADPTLKPEEILILSPNLEQAAPLMDAVFSHSGLPCQIPYVVTGRPGNRINPVSRCLADMLALLASRLNASDVYTLITHPLIAARFGFLHQESLLHQFMQDSAICWALDGAQKEQMQLPATEAHSFQEGFERLFLGYALPDDQHAPETGLLAAGHAEGSTADVLGAFWQCMDTLRHWRERVMTPAKPAEWRMRLLDLLEAICAIPEDLREDDLELREQINNLFDGMETGCPTHLLALPLIREALDDAMTQTLRGGAPAGAVTLAAMHSLRFLPYRHIYLVGMNADQFPRPDRPDEFDLMALLPRAGDRQHRQDDRNLFLDIVLAAQEKLVISYTGRSVRDNSERPPSILVTELLDWLLPRLAHTPEAHAAATRALVLEHPLQAFSLRYFSQHPEDAALKSCQTVLCEALQARQQAQLQASYYQVIPEDARAFEQEERLLSAMEPMFFTHPLAPPDATERHLTLEDLIAFFSHPARYLLQRRLGIYFPHAEESLPVHEPFVAARDAGRRLASLLIPACLEGESENRLLQIARSARLYPVDKPGERCLELDMQQITAFAQRLAPLYAVAEKPPCSHRVEFNLGKEIWTLSGSLHPLRATGMLHYRYAKARPQDYLEGWLTHLFLNLAAPADVSRQSTGVFSDTLWQLSPCDEARALLHRYISLYRQGLCAPLPFFPRAAWEYVQESKKADAQPEKSLENALKSFEGGWSQEWSESRDIYNRLAFRGKTDLVNGVFADHATALFDPLHTYLHQEAL